MTHICISTIISGSDNGLSPGRRQAIIWTNAEILLIAPLGINLNEIVIEINTFSLKKMHLKMSSWKWRQFCLTSMWSKKQGHGWVITSHTYPLIKNISSFRVFCTWFTLCFVVKIQVSLTWIGRNLTPCNLKNGPECDEGGTPVKSQHLLRSYMHWHRRLMSVSGGKGYPPT